MAPIRDIFSKLSTLTAKRSEKLNTTLVELNEEILRLNKMICFIEVSIVAINLVESNKEIGSAYITRLVGLKREVGDSVSELTNRSLLVASGRRPGNRHDASVGHEERIDGILDAYKMKSKNSERFVEKLEEIWGEKYETKERGNDTLTVPSSSAPPPEAQLVDDVNIPMKDKVKEAVMNTVRKSLESNQETNRYDLGTFEAELNKAFNNLSPFSHDETVPSSLGTPQPEAERNVLRHRIMPRQFLMVRTSLDSSGRLSSDAGQGSSSSSEYPMSPKTSKVSIDSQPYESSVISHSPPRDMWIESRDTKSFEESREKYFGQTATAEGDDSTSTSAAAQDSV